MLWQQWKNWKQQKLNLKKKAGKKARRVILIIACCFVWILLCCWDMFLLLAASSYVALTSYGNSFYFLRKQVFSTAVGLLPMGFCTIIDYRRWRNFAKYAYMGSLITVFLVLSPIGIENHGAKRWVGVE